MASNNPVSACPTNGGTLPGLSCDANGWTVFAPTPDASFTNWAAQEGTGYSGSGTRIIYVSSSRGSDSGCSGNPPAGCTNDGSFLHPFATLFTAGLLVRNNSPDWVLADCNDTFTDGYGGANEKGGGPNNAHPAVYGIFDKNIYSASVAPDPDPSSCPGQVQVNITVSSPQSLGQVFGGTGFQSNRFNHVALVGYNFYCQDRDPIGTGYNTTKASTYTSGTGASYTDDGALFENNTIRFCGGLNFSNTCLGCTGQQGFYSFMTNVYVRRNVIYGNYPANSNAEQGVGLPPVGTGVVLFENLIDQNGWSTDAAATWAPRTANFGRNLYLQFYGVNGDPASLGIGFNFSSNTLAENTTGGEQWRPGNSTYEDNLFIQEPGTITNGLNTIANATGNWLRNVYTDASAVGSGVTGIQFNSRYLFGLSNSLTSSTINANTNFFVNSPFSQGGGDVGMCIGCTNNGTTGGFVGLTANGNVVYDFGVQNSSGYKRTTGGVVCTTDVVHGGCQVSAGGTGYTDNTISFTSTCSSSDNTSGCNGVGLGDGQNNIVVITASTPYGAIANTGNCYYKFSSGGDTSLHGPFSCGLVLGATNTRITIWDATWNSGMTSLGGTIYYPWYAVPMTVTGAGTSSTCNSSAPPKMELISVGGSIVFAGIGGSDNSWGPGSEQPDDPSDSCTTGDTITVTNGASCANNPISSCSFPGGSGLAVKVDQASTTTFQATGCNPASNNVNDPAGNTCTSFTDPGRNIGSYYGTQIAGATANCTFTVSSIGTPTSNIAVMTVSNANSCTIKVGDGVTWSGQNKAAVIVGDSTHNASLCGTSCTGNGSNTGTYALNTVSNTGATGTTTISDWQSIQFVKAQRSQSKQNWKSTLTACSAAIYIMGGFGVTNPCTP